MYSMKCCVRDARSTLWHKTVGSLDIILKSVGGRRESENNGYCTIVEFSGESAVCGASKFVFFFESVFYSVFVEDRSSSSCLKCIYTRIRINTNVYYGFDARFPKSISVETQTLQFCLIRKDRHTRMFDQLLNSSRQDVIEHKCYMVRLRKVAVRAIQIREKENDKRITKDLNHGLQ